MTKINLDLKIEEKLVLVVDICSSTSITDDLILTNRFDNYRNVIIRLEDFINKISQKQNFEVYKFLGDGWILIFPKQFNYQLHFKKILIDLCLKYRSLSSQSPYMSLV